MEADRCSREDANAADEADESDDEFERCECGGEINEADDEAFDGGCCACWNVKDLDVRARDDDDDDDDANDAVGEGSPDELRLPSELREDEDRFEDGDNCEEAEAAASEAERSLNRYL